MNTLETIRAKIRADIAADEAGILGHGIIRRTIEKWRGKKITRRLLADVQKGCPDGVTAYWRDQYGMLQIELSGLPGAGEGYSYSFLIGHHHGAGLESYDPDTFERMDSCHAEPARQRNRDRAALLADTASLKTYTAAVDRVRDSWAMLDGIEFGTPAYQIIHDLQRMTGLEKRR